jgi:hypothetical protein
LHPCNYKGLHSPHPRGPDIPAVLRGEVPASIENVVFRDTSFFRPGTLGENLPAWEFLLTGHPERVWLLSWLQDGVSIQEFMTPFTGKWKGKSYNAASPPPAAFRNHPAALSPEFQPFVSSKIAEMVASGALRRLGRAGTVPRPRVVLPIGVEPTKPRLICDARYISLWCRDLPFSFENLSMLPRLADAAEPMFALDHTSGYVHVLLTADSETYFGLEWDGDYYVYRTLSFGWKASPFVYNTLSGAVAQFLRRLQIRNLFYLDDSIYLPLRLPTLGSYTPQQRA